MFTSLVFTKEEHYGFAQDGTFESGFFRVCPSSWKGTNTQ